MSGYFKALQTSSGIELVVVTGTRGQNFEKAQELLGEQVSKFVPFYGSNQIDVEPDPAGAGFEELPPLDPNNPRSGRWQGEKLECGIHVQAK